MVYMSDVAASGGSMLDAAWRATAAFGRRVWNAMIRAQEARARLMIEVYLRDGLGR